MALCAATGCTPPPQQVMQPYAYGVQTDDWFIEEQARACVRACDGLVGDERLVCVSSCPGFVTANVISCEEVPAWEDCAIALRRVEPTPIEQREQSRQEGRVGKAVAHGLVAIVRAGFAAALEEDDDDDDDESEERESVRRPKKDDESSRRPLEKRVRRRGQ